MTKNKKYIDSETINKEYDEWFYKFNNNHEFITLSFFRKFLEIKYEEYDNIATSLNIWKNSYNRLIQINRDKYIDKIYQPFTYEEYSKLIFFESGNKLLRDFRVDDSAYSKRSGIKISNNSLLIKDSKEEALNDFNLIFYKIKYASKLFNSKKQFEINFSDILEKYEIDITPAKNHKDVIKIIDDNIKKVNRYINKFEEKKFYELKNYFIKGRINNEK